MSETKIPTAEEFISTYSGKKFISEIMIEFTKLHVQAQAEAIKENARVTTIGGHKYAREEYIVDEESILNAYPLENIK